MLLKTMFDHNKCNHEHNINLWKNCQKTRQIQLPNCIEKTRQIRKFRGKTKHRNSMWTYPNYNKQCSYQPGMHIEASLYKYNFAANILILYKTHLRPHIMKMHFTCCHLLKKRKDRKWRKYTNIFKFTLKL